jgi:hypothetical protein
MNEIIKKGIFSILINDFGACYFSEESIKRLLDLNQEAFSKIINESQIFLEAPLIENNEVFYKDTDVKLMCLHPLIEANLKREAAKEIKEALEVIRQMRSGSKWEILKRDHEITGKLIKQIESKFTHYDLTLEDHSEKITCLESTQEQIDKDHRRINQNQVNLNTKVEAAPEIAHEKVINELKECSIYQSDIKLMRELMVREWLNLKNMRYEDRNQKTMEGNIINSESTYFYKTILNKWLKEGCPNWKGKIIPQSPFPKAGNKFVYQTLEEQEKIWKWHQFFFQTNEKWWQKHKGWDKLLW